jgi:hypothetical protein
MGTDSDQRQETGMRRRKRRRDGDDNDQGWWQRDNCTIEWT